MYSFISSLFVIFFLLLHADAFSFSVGDPTQCDDLTITWTGGTAPFQLLLFPVFGTTRNISIPANAFNNGQGSLSFPLEFAEKQQFVATMSDAAGFGTGGTTELLTVGSSQGGSCNTTDPGVAYSFELNSALTQCRPYVVSAYDQAVQPVTIYGIIPSGTPFVLNPPTGPTSFTWTANVAPGTSIIFAMTDSQGRQGGSSDVKIVGISDDSSCLDSSSPSSTSALPTSTTSKSSTASSSTTSSASSESTTNTASNGNVSIGAIAGTVIGALLFLAVIITLGLFFLRKRRDEKTYSSGLAGGRGDGGGSVAPAQHSRMQSQYDFNSGSQNPSSRPYGVLDANSTTAFAPGYDQYNHSNAGLSYDRDPFSDSPPSQYTAASRNNGQQFAPYQNDSLSQYTATTQYPPTTPHSTTYPPPARSMPLEDPFNPYVPSQAGIVEPFDQFGQPSGNTSSRDSMSTAQRKAAMAGNTAYKPSRFILHTDLEDVVPADNEEEVVELPPQYSERRAPPAGPDPAPTPSHPPPSLAQHSLPALNPWQESSPAISL